MNIQQFDKNFALKKYTARENTEGYNVLSEPFSLHGLLPPRHPEDVFRRMPEQTANSVSEAVAFLHTNCAGGRVRFCTNSAYIAVLAKMGEIGKMPHFALTGSAGFDLYCGASHIASFQPSFDITDELFGEVTDCGGEMREYTLNFPLYSQVRELYIILERDAQVMPPKPYTIAKPVVFYGSSVTQGGCASRPGTCYSAVLSRRMDFEHMNLGFSGSAMGEPEMADYIAGLEMSAFIYDYDYNAPDAEHLEKTHERFFQTIRRAHPDIPIVCLNRPFFLAEAQRTAIIRRTVENAQSTGDKNVYFLDIYQWLRQQGVENEATVDRCHPNDLGFYYMAQAVEEVLRHSLLGL